MRLGLPELQLIILSPKIVLGNEDASKAQMLLRDGMNWPLLRELAAWHRLSPFVNKVLHLHQSLVPEEVLTLWQEDQKVLVTNNFKLTTGLVRLKQFFEKEKVPFIQVKGLSLATLTYGDIGYRPSLDLDVIIPPEHANVVIERLAEELDLHREAKLSPEHEALVTQVNCEAALFGPFHLDLHWAFSRFPRMFPIPFRRALDEPSYVSLGGLQIPTLPLPELVTYICFHGSKHLWARLFWICDLYGFLLKKDMEWATILETADALGQRRPLLQGVLLASDIFSAELPAVLAEACEQETCVKAQVAEIKQLLFEREFAVGKSEIHLSNRQKLSWWRRMYADPVTKMVVVLGYLFAPGSHDMESVHLPKPLYPLYYLVRPARLLLSLFQKPV